MKTSLEWLSEFLPGPPLDAQACGDALTAGGLPVENIERHGQDTVLDVEVTSNRSDCLSHIGVARELAALLNREFRDSAPARAAESQGNLEGASVAIEEQALCPLYIARVIRGVKIGPSPAWMVRRLEAVGVRAINNVVDVTNYVLFELGQPLHAFDLNLLKGNRIIVRRAGKGGTIVSIDGRERALTPDMLVIGDAERAVAVAGVMGGINSEVSNSTTDVLLESARFDPLSVRKTSRELALKSDSSSRFERGIDPLAAERASLRAAQLIVETAGGKLSSGSARAGGDGFQPRSISLRLSQLKRILGIEIPPQKVLESLKKLHFSPVLRDERVDVEAPSYRLDINTEIDLVEEVARIIGYSQIPIREQIAVRVTAPDAVAKSMQTIRSTLVASGFFESVTFSFVSDALAKDFLPAADVHASAPLLRADPSVRKADAHLRPSILPGLLESIRHNESVGSHDAQLFEIGSIFWRDAAGEVREKRQVALAGGLGFREMRGTVEALLRKLDPNRLIAIVPDTRPGIADAACGKIEWGGKAIGYLGIVEKVIADKLSLRQPPPVAELDLDPLVTGTQHVPQLKPLAKFPAVRRDLSLVMPERTRYEQLESIIHQLQLQWLETVEYVTTYRGKPLDKGVKSITITLVFRSSAETLTGEQVDASVQRVIEAAGRQGWTLRT